MASFINLIVLMDESYQSMSGGWKFYQFESAFNVPWGVVVIWCLLKQTFNNNQVNE